MKLSKREINLLIFLGFVAVVIFIYMVALKPQLDKIHLLQADANQGKIDIEELKKDVSPDNMVYKDLKIMNAKVDNATKGLFGTIIQEKLITILDQKVSAAKIDATSITFSSGDQMAVTTDEAVAVEAPTTNLLHQLVKNYAGEKIADKVVTPESKPAVTKEENSLDGLEKLSAMLNYTGTYYNVIDILKEIESYPKRIIIKSINFSRDTKDVLSGSINLVFYAVPLIDPKKDEYQEWNYTDKYGRDNPFSAFSGYSTGSAGTVKIPEVKKYDFLMTVKPVASDLPAIILGRANDSQAKSYVYSDDSGFNNVEIQVMQDAGKYYFRYKTNYESYPKIYATDKIEFTPTGTSISFNIMSMPRNDNKDLSGVKLSVINDTQLPFEIVVTNDDASSPRVVLENKKGNVSMKKE